MKRPVRLSIATGFGLLCLSFLGCLNVPFSIPEINTIPPISMGTASNDVHIFRVDIAERITVDPGDRNSPGVPKAVSTYQLTEIAPDSPGTTPRQTELTCRQGWRVVGFWNYNSDCVRHTIALHLYRPGYETIAVQCGQVPNEVHWTKASDLEAQEKAVDDLIGVALLEEPGDARPQSQRVKQNLALGTTSASQREAILFCAGECERLARHASRDSVEADSLARLLAKAARLKELADGEEKASEL